MAAFLLIHWILLTLGSNCCAQFVNICWPCRHKSCPEWCASILDNETAGRDCALLRNKSPGLYCLVQRNQLQLCRCDKIEKRSIRNTDQMSLMSNDTISLYNRDLSSNRTGGTESNWFKWKKANPDYVRNRRIDRFQTATYRTHSNGIRGHCGLSICLLLFSVVFHYVMSSTGAICSRV